MARTNSIKNWLLITRAPTLLSVLVPVMVGFLAAGGELFTVRGLGFVAFAWAMHHFTFAHNSLLDAAYDVGKKDPEHHPLASGAVSLGQARTVVYAGMLVTCALGAALALTGGGNPAASLVCLLFFVIGGFAYNECSKVAPKAWALLALSFACLTPFAYFAVAPAADARMILLAGYFFLTFWFETWWSGNLKDLEFAGANALRDLGVRVRGGRLVVEKKLALYARVLKLSAIALAFAAMFGKSAFSGLCAGLIAALTIQLSWGLTQERAWDRPQVVFEIGCVEVASLLMPLVAAAGWAEVLALAGFGIAWTLGTTRAAYGPFGKNTPRRKDEGKAEK